MREHILVVKPKEHYNFCVAKVTAYREFFDNSGHTMQDVLESHIPHADYFEYSSATLMSCEEAVGVLKAAGIEATYHDGVTEFTMNNETASTIVTEKMNKMRRAVDKVKTLKDYILVKEHLKAILGDEYGTWVMNTSIGTIQPISDFIDDFVGFRITEEFVVYDIITYHW